MPLPTVDEVELLRGPHEILELADGETVRFHIDDAEIGHMQITPRDTGRPKEIIALRVHVPQTEKRLFPHYWDLTAQTLVEQVLPWIETDRYRGRTFEVTKHGASPKARFSLRVTPPT